MNRWLAIGTGVAIAATFLYGYHLGARHKQAAWDVAVKEQTERTLVNLQGSIDFSHNLGLKLNDENARVEFVTETIIKEIPIYVKDTVTCPALPDGWGVLHDLAATSGSRPAAAVGDD